MVVRAIWAPKSPGQRSQVGINRLGNDPNLHLGSLSNRFGLPNRPDNEQQQKKMKNHSVGSLSKRFGLPNRPGNDPPRLEKTMKNHWFYMVFCFLSTHLEKQFQFENNTKKTQKILSWDCCPGDLGSQIARTTIPSWHKSPGQRYQVALGVVVQAIWAPESPRQRSQSRPNRLDNNPGTISGRSSAQKTF